MEIKTGFVTAIIQSRGFGFIQDEAGENIFFHVSGLQNIEFSDFKEGDKVSFNVVDTHKGTKAISIQVI